MINIVIPMAGCGARFQAAGYKDPKPFIKIFGKTLIEIVLENLKIKNARYILVVKKEHVHFFSAVLNRLKKAFKIHLIVLTNKTEGALISILAAHKLINNSNPLLLANCDQFVDFKVAEFLEDARKRNLDGSILTFKDKLRNPKWSFAKVNSSSFVVEVKEKCPFSDYATVGIYYFKRGSAFVSAALDLIISNDRVNGEFYTCPVFNYLIKFSYKIGFFNLNLKQMHGLGTPEDLEIFKSRYFLRFFNS